jgi:hypothetical protein
MTTTYAACLIEYKRRPIDTLRREVDVTEKHQKIRAVRNELNAIDGGVAGREAMVRIILATVAASATATLVQASISAADTITIGGTALTARVTPTLTSEFAIGTTDTESGTNLKNAINANATLQKFVWASSVLGVVTITSVYPGPVGNFILISKSSTGITLSGVALASGSSDEMDQLQMGYQP